MKNICKDCKNKDICKYKDNVEKSISNFNTEVEEPLEIEIKCKYFDDGIIKSVGNLNGIDHIGNPYMELLHVKDYNPCANCSNTGIACYLCPNSPYKITCEAEVK